MVVLLADVAVAVATESAFIVEEDVAIVVDVVKFKLPLPPAITALPADVVAITPTPPAPLPLPLPFKLSVTFNMPMGVVAVAVVVALVLKLVPLI